MTGEALGRRRSIVGCICSRLCPKLLLKGLVCRLWNCHGGNYSSSHGSSYSASDGGTNCDWSGCRNYDFDCPDGMAGEKKSSHQRIYILINLTRSGNPRFLQPTNVVSISRSRAVTSTPASFSRTGSHLGLLTQKQSSSGSFQYAYNLYLLCICSLTSHSLLNLRGGWQTIDLWRKPQRLSPACRIAMKTTKRCWKFVMKSVEPWKRKGRPRGLISSGMEDSRTSAVCFWDSEHCTCNS